MTTLSDAALELEIDPAIALPEPPETSATESPPLDEQQPEEDYILQPGDHLVELLTRYPLAPDALSAALDARGWTAIAVDELTDEDPASFGPIWDAEPGRAFTRFVGKLERPFRPLPSPMIEWVHSHPIRLNTFANIQRLTTLPFALRTGATYEIRFVSRLKGQPTRGAVIDGLGAMAGAKQKGFSVHKLSALKRNIRLPDRPNASAILWYCLAKWEGPNSYIVIEDPFFFEDVVEVEG